MREAIVSPPSRRPWMALHGQRVPLMTGRPPWTPSTCSMKSSLFPGIAFGPFHGLAGQRADMRDDRRRNFDLRRLQRRPWTMSPICGLTSCRSRSGPSERFYGGGQRDGMVGQEPSSGRASALRTQDPLLQRLFDDGVRRFSQNGDFIGRQQGRAHNSPLPGNINPFD